MQRGLDHQDGAGADGGARRRCNRAVLIAGPTASGKSALALEIAARLPDALIINCDSMQVYRDLAIVTARPDAKDLAEADHALYGHRDGAEPYSAAIWRDEVAALLAGAGEHALIFVGGTGLYFRVLLEGLSPVPPVPDAVRAEVREAIARDGSVTVHAQLDEAMADQLSPTDSQRVARAREVLVATGRSLADWQALPPDGGLVAFDPSRSIVLGPDRALLEARIAARANRMLEPDGCAEVQNLLARGLSRDLPVMRAIGVEVLASYVAGVTGRQDALEALTVQTRRYAKRQQTWFRGQMGDWTWVWPEAAEDRAALADRMASAYATGE